MTEKFLDVTMPDNSVWRVPCQFIVFDRAQYHAKQDSQKELGNYQEIFASEYAFAMHNDSEIIDWAANNMNWDDVAPLAQRLPVIQKELTKKEFQQGWVNGDKKIVNQ